MYRRLSVLLSVSVAFACSVAEQTPNDAASDSAAAAAAAPSSSAEVGSEISMDSLLRQFQTGMPHADSLAGTSLTREALTRRYLDAVARSDTGALRRMHITRAEYAFLYFASSKMMKPPYELPPDVAWLLQTGESNKGIGSVMRRFGGQRLEFEGVRCPGEPLREGANVVWRDCVVRYRDARNAEHERPLFAAIIERGGRFKFFSYATSL